MVYTQNVSYVWLIELYNRNKPYDPKKSVWMVDGEGGFLEGVLQLDDGKKAVVMVGHEVSIPRHACIISM